MNIYTLSGMRIIADMNKTSIVSYDAKEKQIQRMCRNSPYKEWIDKNTKK